MGRPFAALAAALAAAAIAPAALVAAPERHADGIRIVDVSAAPQPPQAGGELQVTARIEFEGTLGSIRCLAYVGGRRFRGVRLTWEASIARCTVPLSRASRGKRLTVTLRAQAGGNRVRQTLGFVIA